MSFLYLCIDTSKLGAEKLVPNFEVKEYDGYYQVGDVKEAIFLQLKKRTARPHTHCSRLDKNTIVFGYGPQAHSFSDEFLEITLHRNGRLRVVRDSYATLPIFYGRSHHLFVLSNKYRLVAERLPSLTLDHTALIDILVPNPHKHPLLWEELGILEEYQELEIDAGRALLIHTSQARAWESSQDAPPSDPRDFRKILSVHLDGFIDNHLEGEYFAFELSGGIDSATLPLYYAKKRRVGKCRPCGSIIYPGSFGVAQSKKLATMLCETGFIGVYTHVDLPAHYPLARMLETNSVRHFYCFEDIYTELIEEMVSQLARYEVTVLVTGIGGDELFENTISIEQQLWYGEAEAERRRRLAYPPFLTNKFYDKYLYEIPAQSAHPLPVLSVSWHGGQLSANNIYIDNDMWPVSPFISRNMYEYCQGLPVYFRANKNILRAFHQAYGFPKIVYNPPHNEHFGEFFTSALTSGYYDPAMQRLAANSVASELGFVDINKLMHAYELCKRDRSDPRHKEWLLFILAWMTAEINLQTVHR